jgi:hypothetical protein
MHTESVNSSRTPTALPVLDHREADAAAAAPGAGLDADAATVLARTLNLITRDKRGGWSSYALETLTATRGAALTPGALAGA